MIPRRRRILALCFWVCLAVVAWSSAFYAAIAGVCGSWLWIAFALTTFAAAIVRLLVHATALLKPKGW